MIPENEYQEVEGQFYVNPQVALDESNAFIQNLRNTQQQNTQQIVADTQSLGTNVPSSLGGLTGAESYWTSRVQTPQTNALVADLRATAQAQALNDVLANEQAIWKNRYQRAYRNYQKSAYNRANSSGSGGNGTLPSTTAGEGEVETIPTDEEATFTYEGSVTAGPGQTVVIGPDGIAQMYVDGEYVELRPGQTYKPPLSLPSNSIGTPSALAPINSLQGR